jgi:hypothetical protein
LIHRVSHCISSGAKRGRRNGRSPLNKIVLLLLLLLLLLLPIMGLKSPQPTHINLWTAEPPSVPERLLFGRISFQRLKSKTII